VELPEKQGLKLIALCGNELISIIENVAVELPEKQGLKRGLV